MMEDLIGYDGDYDDADDDDDGNDDDCDLDDDDDDDRGDDGDSGAGKGILLLKLIDSLCCNYPLPSLYRMLLTMMGNHYDNDDYSSIVCRRVS